MIISVILYICFVGLIFSIVMLIRNEIVYKYTIEALEITSNRAKKLIDEGCPDFMSPYKKLEEYGSYNQMLFDISAWKFEDFFPRLLEIKNISKNYGE
jgi:hypothetical protein